MTKLTVPNPETPPLRTINRKKMLSEAYSLILQGPTFYILFLILGYSLAMPAFFLINIKNFGFLYFSDSSLTNLTYFSAAVAFASRIGSGEAVDKWGTFKVYKFVLVLASFTVLAFLFMSDNYWVFCLSIGVFYLLYALASVMLTGLTTFCYGIELGTRLQKYMFLSKSVGGILALFLDAVL